MAEVVKLIIPTDEIILEVNDDGDTISLPVSDERFNQRLLKFAEKVSSEADKLSSFQSDDIFETVSNDIQFHEMLRVEFNALFGDKAYEKVFGEDIVVGAEYVMEFIDKCMPYIQKHTVKRAEKFSKYSADRVGSSL